MKVLLIGSGAKEYSIAKKISYYENVSLVFVAPGNDAISEFANCVDIKSDDIENLVSFAKENEIDLTIVASETAIDAGVAERFNSEGLSIFAPTAEASRIISSKSLAKKFMYKTKIPTPKFGIFDRENMAIDYARKSQYPLVVKTDMHLSGENVYICDSFRIAKRIIETLFDEKHKKIVIEDYLCGQEFSYYVISDGYNAMPLQSIVPYKGTLEGNGGSVTSGLGAYAPFYMLHRNIEGRIFREIVYPLLDELAKNGTPYIGVLGIDIILGNDNKLNVLEFNSFFKEPDAQCFIELLDENLLNLARSAVVGSLVDEYSEVKSIPSYAASVVLMSGNYPNDCDYGANIKIDDEVYEFANVAHFNTIKAGDENPYMTVGGRTLSVTAIGSTLESSVNKVYDAIELINFDKMKYRKDIGKRVMIGL